MRVKISVIIALAVLLIASAMSAGASSVTVLAPSQAQTALKGIFTFPDYGSTDAGGLAQVDSIVKNVKGLSTDMYDSHGSGLPSAAGGSLSNGPLSEIPNPMALITAMAPDSFAGGTFTGGLIDGLRNRWGPL